MSYCRFGDDSDVYLYPNLDDYLTCMGCKLPDSTPDVVTLRDAAAALQHLEAHRAAGHRVPQHALDRLQLEAGHE